MGTSSLPPPSSSQTTASYIAVHGSVAISFVGDHRHTHYHTIPEALVADQHHHCRQMTAYRTAWALFVWRWPRRSLITTPLDARLVSPSP